MGIVDTLMVGPLGPEAIGGVGLAGILFFALAACGMGILLGLDTVVSQAYGAGDHEACRRWLWQGLWLGLLAAVPLAGLLWLQRTLARSLRRQPGHRRGRPRQPRRAVADAAAAVRLRRVAALSPGDRPGAAGDVRARRRQHRQRDRQLGADLRAPRACPRSAPTAPPGPRSWRGSRWPLVPLAAIVWHDLRHHTGTPVWRVRLAARSAAALAALLRLGVPAMLQMVFEVGVFALASSMAASQPPTAIAAHQVSLELAGLAFMVPLGIASAAAVRVGHAVGRRDGPGAEHAGWAAILMGIDGDGDHGAPLRAAAAAPDRRLLARPRRDPDRHLAARRRRRVRGLRWRAGRSRPAPCAASARPGGR